ncbi:IS110 family transposase [Companilactobacillus nantensis]|uniref:Transposase n=1 Tax=Companilactobacillus nantensis DSM 16982 TaxID=1423774 RepID=A0A0R1WE41_9LACO|nr:IS110 family transposase [Companilactobacillus nantensis]KRM13961.1 transposase [Companilactobacillus nantensis DSM 16982]GEO65578.1 IS110 family transposase [Companilactobacillus nantensis]
MSDIIALDVSKGHSYCVSYHDGNCTAEFNFTHNKIGFARLRATAKLANNPTFYFEATGVYSRPIERFCKDNKIPYALLNPLELHLKTENLRRIKTDIKDAHKIALSAYDNNYRLMYFQDEKYSNLKEKCRFYEQVEADRKYYKVKMKTALQQTFPEMEQLFTDKASVLALNVTRLYPHPDLVSDLSKTKLKNTMKKETGKRISDTVALNYAEKLLRFAKNSCPSAHVNDPQVDEVKYYATRVIENTIEKRKLIKEMIKLGKKLPEFEIISSMPCIGEMTAAMLIGEIGNFTRFDNSNQLNAYIGIDLMRYQSGRSQKKDHINKRGNPKARAVLYSAVRNMIKQQASAQNHIVDYYYKLKKQPVPKRDKVATVACMNKTLKCLFSMINNNTKYSYTYRSSKPKEML